MAAIDTLLLKIRRDTRDTGTSDGYDRAFSQQELTDLVELALAEISRAYAREHRNAFWVGHYLSY